MTLKSEIKMEPIVKDEIEIIELQHHRMCDINSDINKDETEVKEEVLCSEIEMKDELI